MIRLFIKPRDVADPHVHRMREIEHVEAVPRVGEFLMIPAGTMDNSKGEALRYLVVAVEHNLTKTHDWEVHVYVSSQFTEDRVLGEIRRHAQECDDCRELLKQLERRLEADAGAREQSNRE